MVRSPKDIPATLDPARRAKIEAEADRPHAEYPALQGLRKAKNPTRVQRAETLGVQQAAVAKFERRSDLLLSTLTSHVRTMGGALKLMVEFPGKAPVAVEGLGETEEPRRGQRAGRQDRSRAMVLP